MSREQEGAPRARRLSDIPVCKSPRMSVVRLKGGQRVVGVILSKFFSGFAIHWNQSIRRSQPCAGKDNACEGCKAELPEKSAWYLHLHSPEKGHFFLEMPPEAADRLLNQLAPGESLRGYRVTAYRTAADNGRLRIEIDPYAPRVENLPPAVDPEATLASLWNWGRA